MLIHNQTQEQPQRRDIDHLRENTPAMACEILTASMPPPDEGERARSEQLSQSAAWSRDPLFRGWANQRHRESTVQDWAQHRADYLSQIYGDNA